MTAKEQYRRLCETEGLYIPLFQQHWWMETVCAGKRWDVLLASSRGRIEGAVPFLYGRKWGLEYILQPQLTPWTGPWLHPELDAEGRRLALDTLAEALRRRGKALSMMCFPPETDMARPFVDRGYNLVTRTTYRFPSLSDPEALYRSASRIRRRYDPSVEEQCYVDPSLSLDEFVPFHIDYYQRRGQRDLIGEPLLRRVVQTSCSRGQGLLWGLRRRTDHALQAAWFVAYDEQCSWSLLLAIGHEAPNGAMSYLMWQAIRELSHRTRAFDFEGGMDSGLAFFYRSFGTEPTPYQCIYRSRIPFGKQILHL